MTCIFCNIITGQIPTTLRYQDDQIIAIDDITPQAPHHLLIIPREHIATINDLNADHGALVGHMVLSARTLAQQLGIDKAGYRLVLNCNADGGQAVYHIHLHLLGGRHMKWPPG